MMKCLDKEKSMILSTTLPIIQLAKTNCRFFAIQKKSKEAIKKLYRTLGVNEDCDDETLRLAFVNLAKRFHPDSGSHDASAVRFSEIESAYRQIQRNRFEEKEREREEDVEEFDIKHTAPQHRHYLEHDVGTGTPFARQRRYTTERARKAVENVMEHRLKKVQAAERNTLVGMDKLRAKDVKTRYGMDRLVEDLIQEAMTKGEFTDLPGMGKPLKNNACNQNPYVDFVTHKLNQVLIDNGFTPEWIQLSKEIREDTDNLKRQLVNVRNRLGDLPLTPEDEYTWETSLSNSVDAIKQINKKIDKYNLLVPILQKQMLQVNLKTLADDILAVAPDKKVKTKADNSQNLSKSSNSGNDLVHMITSIFGKQ